MAKITVAGTAATKATGTAADNVVVLDGSGKLPPVDGSQLTNLPSQAVDGTAINPLSTGLSTAGPGVFTGLHVNAIAGPGGGVWYLASGFYGANVHVGYHSSGIGGNNVEVLGGSIDSVAGSFTKGTGSHDVTLTDGSSGFANLSLGNLAAVGTISGRRVCRSITANATAVVTQSGSTLPDEVFLVNATSGSVTVTVPTLSLTGGQIVSYLVIDAGNTAGTSGHTVSVTVNDTGQTFSIPAAGGWMLLTIDTTTGAHAKFL